MIPLLVLLIVGLVVFYASQCYMAVGLVRKLWRWQPARLEDGQCPKAAVILCLRGKDPFLDQCIESLLRQDYPDYEVHVVVDHESDPACSVVQACVERLEATNVHVEILEDRRTTCSLKCSSLLHAMDHIGSSREVVALLDADTWPHPTWLRELVAPLREAGVGAATGNRWYMPANPSVGTAMRYFWNVFAIMQMVCFRIAWGGSLAVRMEVVRNTNLLDAWSRAFCEDTMMYSILRKQGLRLVFVPSLIMINREDCDAGNYFRWVGRQLLTARLYHPQWPAVAFHGFCATILPLGVLALAVTATLAGNGVLAVAVVAAFGVYLGALLLLLWPLESGVRRIVASRGERTAWMSPRFFVCCLGAIPLLQVLYPIALLSASLMRNVQWRGVEYHIDGSWKIRMLEYRPYQPTSAQATNSL